MQRILLIGPKENRRDSSATGGAIVLFANLLEYMEKEQLLYRVIDTNKENYNSTIGAYISMVSQILFRHYGCSIISLHSSANYVVLAPVILLLGRLFGKKTSLRKFGGEAANHYNESSFLKKMWLNVVFSKIDILFFETKYLMAFYLDLNPNTYWFPNVRDRKFEPSMPRKFNKRFVFIGHVKEEKGIDEILKASLKLDRQYCIDIYGPLCDEKYTSEYFEGYNVNYLGPLLPGEVIGILNKYDVLVLPSYKEGYPGILLEAYSLGIPVIATSLQGLREIVDPEETGILIEKKSVLGLVNAVLSIDDDKYRCMSDGAYKKFDNFDSTIQTRIFLEQLAAVSKTE